MKRLILLSALFISILSACDKATPEPLGPILSGADSLEVSVSAGGLVIGASATDSTEISIAFAGEVASDSLHTAKSYGVIYASVEADSLTVKNSKMVVVRKLDEFNRFTLDVEKLTPGAGYMWTVFVEVEGEFILGEVRTFRTLALVAPEVEEVTDISYDEVTFEGTVTVPSKVYKDLEYGILYSDDERALKKFSGEIHEIDKDEIKKKGIFSSVLSGLDDDTEYFYIPYITMNKVTVYGEMGDFETDSAPEPGKGVSGTDLSKGEKAPANCYIVSEGGTYKFPALKGNGKSYVSGGAFAEVLWESFGTDVTPVKGDLVSKVAFKNNYVSFVVPETFKEGNAVVAVKNASGKILWSWHIWLTDQPAECVLVNDAGTLMDRNLGATSAEPGVIESYGLMYQWGRKDPFMGSALLYEVTWDQPSPFVSSTAEWPEWDNTDGGVQESIENPMMVMSMDNDASYPTLWVSERKTIYDPCPSGWKVPGVINENFWGTVAGCAENYEAFVSRENGVILPETFSFMASWLPFAGKGYIGYYGGVLEAGRAGGYWLASFELYDGKGVLPYCYFIESNGRMTSAHFDNSGSNNTFSIRCIKE